MAALSPPPIQNSLVNSVGLPGQAWAKWFQQTFQTFSGASLAAELIIAAHTSSTQDFGALKVGDVVLVIPATAGNSHFVTVVTASTLPEAAVVGSLYVALRVL